MSNSDGKNLAFIPDHLPPTLQWEAALTAVLSRADRALGELKGIGNHLDNPHILIRPFLNREAISSSRIEGTHAGLEDLYALEASEGEVTDDSIAPDAPEVQNYVRALKQGIELLPSLPLSLRLIRELHKTLLTNVRGGSAAPGEFRTLQNWIGAQELPNAPFVPPPAQDVVPSLSALESYMQLDDSTPPLVRIALIHYQFEAIHPFYDGNGRVGRLLIPLLLSAWGLLPLPLLYISSYFEQNNERYIHELRSVSRNASWESYLRFFLSAVERQAADAIKFVTELMRLRDAWHKRLTSMRANALVLSLADSLFRSAYITIPKAQKLADVTYPTASNYIDQLSEAGILMESSKKLSGTTAKVFEATAILDLGKGV